MIYRIWLLKFILFIYWSNLFQIWQGILLNRYKPVNLKIHYYEIPLKQTHWQFFHDCKGQEEMTLKLWLLRLLSFFHWQLFTLIQIFELKNLFLFFFFLIRVDQYIIYIAWLFFQTLPFLWCWPVQFASNFHCASVTAIYNNSAAL